MSAGDIYAFLVGLGLWSAMLLAAEVVNWLYLRTARRLDALRTLPKEGRSDG